MIHQPVLRFFAHTLCRYIRKTGVWGWIYARKQLIQLNANNPHYIYEPKKIISRNENDFLKLLNPFRMYRIFSQTHSFMVKHTQTIECVWPFLSSLLAQFFSNIIFILRSRPSESVSSYNSMDFTSRFYSVNWFQWWWWSSKYNCNATFCIAWDLIHSFPMHPLSTSWNYQKTLRFSGGRESVHWEQMG